MDAKRQEKSSASKADNPLDEMFGDMEGLGVAMTSKGTCPTCGRPVMGEAVAALGKVWHRGIYEEWYNGIFKKIYKKYLKNISILEHFVCTIDDKEIGGDPYFSWNDEIYCERHYNELFSPQCAKCEEPILEDMISAMNKSFHQACFSCFKCDTAFTTSFHEHEG